ncbi:unnamed protein product [Rhizoctonia solani]|uniref:Protein kinase domain-containing protein n=1 Tax=Rhizoctonia solani TaxID=456999 RepID=A0A8H3BK02_9AGAM|nr:unnamed protein product [Rhizoctonia solani]
MCRSLPDRVASCAWTLGSASQPRRPKFRNTRDRNFLVLPVQLGQKRSPLDAFPFTSYTTIDLKTRYVLDPNLTQEVDEVWVDAGSYYKQKQGQQHEFIIFSVTSTTGMQNFIALDRNVHAKGWASLLFQGGKSGPPAQDYFHISHYADIGSLISHCGNTASEELCTHVEQVAFEPKAFSFPQLVVLASTVSESCPSYQLGATNCYWFASLIWECMFNVFAEGVTRHKKNTEERGRFRGLKIQGAHGNFEEVVEKYKKDIAEFSRNLTDEATIVMNKRSQRMSALPSNPPEFEKDSNAPAASMESRRSRAILTATTLAASAFLSEPNRAQESPNSIDHSNLNSIIQERAYILKGLESTSTSFDVKPSGSTNKGLPDLPAAPAPHFSRPLAQSVEDSNRNPIKVTEGSGFGDKVIEDTPAPPGILHNKKSLSHLPESTPWFARSLDKYPSEFNSSQNSSTQNSSRLHIAGYEGQSKPGLPSPALTAYPDTPHPTNAPKLSSIETSATSLRPPTIPQGHQKSHAISPLAGELVEGPAANKLFSDPASQSTRTGEINTLDGQSRADTQHDEGGFGFGNHLITRQTLMEEILEELTNHGCENLTTQIDLANLSKYPVARGGFSDVYRGLLHGRVEPVCLKTLRHVIDHADTGNKQPKLAAQELYIWSKIAQFRHPNVLEFLGMAVFRGQIAMISPWMGGGTLSRYLHDQPQVDRYRLCYQIASAVAYLHNEGVAHGDIRGDNILLSEDRQVLKLADFGNANPVGSQWSLQFSRSSRSVVTTFRWTAPEILRDDAVQAHTPKSDVYALGMDTAVYMKLLGKQHPARPEDCLPLDDKKADLLWPLLLECWDYDPDHRLGAHRLVGLEGYEWTADKVLEGANRILKSTQYVTTKEGIQKLKHGVVIDGQGFKFTQATLHDADIVTTAVVEKAQQGLDDFQKFGDGAFVLAQKGVEDFAIVEKKSLRLA